ncbi:MAG: LemA family protein [Rickettsiales bacterium]|jgi:LemA protein|nr:LemA family protein [Rickettsiales bacterium]
MWIAIAVIAVVLLYVIGVYNGLVARRNQSREAWATIETQLKRRHDLIPNLVAAVKGAAKHESGTLEAVIKARNSAISAGDDKKSAAENKLTGALKNIFALAESYPALRANENFLELQGELSDTETKIQSARQFYNTVVMGLNTAIQSFPSNIIANLFRIREEKLFELDAEEKRATKNAPQVEF